MNYTMNFSKDLFYPFSDTFIYAYTSLKELLHIDSLTFHAGKSVKRKTVNVFNLFNAAGDNWSSVKCTYD